MDVAGTGLIVTTMMRPVDSHKAAWLDLRGRSGGSGASVCRAPVCNNRAMHYPLTAPCLCGRNSTNAPAKTKLAKPQFLHFAACCGRYLNDFAATPVREAGRWFYVDGNQL